MADLQNPTGHVATYSDLPGSPTEGDVYIVDDTQKAFQYTAGAWTELTEPAAPPADSGTSTPPADQATKPEPAPTAQMSQPPRDYTAEEIAAFKRAAAEAQAVSGIAPAPEAEATT